jgi:hypothetical protein
MSAHRQPLGAPRSPVTDGNRRPHGPWLVAWSRTPPISMRKTRLGRCSSNSATASQQSGRGQGSDGHDHRRPPPQRCVGCVGIVDPDQGRRPDARPTIDSANRQRSSVKCERPRATAGTRNSSVGRRVEIPDVSTAPGGDQPPTAHPRCQRGNGAVLTFDLRISHGRHRAPPLRQDSDHLSRIAPGKASSPTDLRRMCTSPESFV